jgi:hypothetical protein
MSDYDVLVFGAGMAGLATAHVRQPRRPAVARQRRPATGPGTKQSPTSVPTRTTSRSGGIERLSLGRRSGGSVGVLDDGAVRLGHRRRRPGPPADVHRLHPRRPPVVHGTIEPVDTVCWPPDTAAS